MVLLAELTFVSCWKEANTNHLFQSSKGNPAAGDLSRNRTVGLRIGKGEKLEDIIKSTNTVAEGVLTSR